MGCMLSFADTNISINREALVFHGSHPIPSIVRKPFTDVIYALFSLLVRNSVGLIGPWGETV